jgi:hypothetical protein
MSEANESPGSFPWIWNFVGPVFHQIFAREFSLEYFPNISEAQREMFVLGSIYADGSHKNISHHLPQLMKQMQNVTDRRNDMYWFLLGIFIHLVPDRFAHAGKQTSFIPAHGIMHHIGEFVVDSLIHQLHNSTYMTLSGPLKQEMTRIGIRPLRYFDFIYPVMYWMAKLPFYKLIFSVSNLNCPSPVCTLKRHWKKMFESGYYSMTRLGHFDFTDKFAQSLSNRMICNMTCQSFIGPREKKDLFSLASEWMHC